MATRVCGGNFIKILQCSLLGPRAETEEREQMHLHMSGAPARTLLSSKWRPHFKNVNKFWSHIKIWLWVPTGLQTENNCAGEGYCTELTHVECMCLSGKAVVSNRRVLRHSHTNMEGRNFTFRVSGHFLLHTRLAATDVTFRSLTTACVIRVFVICMKIINIVKSGWYSIQFGGAM